MILLLLLQSYDLETDAPKEDAAELLAFMEGMRKQYAELLPRKDVPRGKIVLHAKRADYDGPAGSAAYYEGGKLVGWCDPVWREGFFAHEGAHQWLDGVDLPIWFAEGVADFLGDLGDLRAKQLPYARPIATFTALDRKAFLSNAPLAYAESWALVTFLVQKHRDVFDAVYAGKAPKLADLEDEFRAWLATVEIPTLAIGAEDEEGGVRVKRGDGRLRKGDLIVKAAGQELPKRRPQAALRGILRKETSREVTLVVRRDGADVDVVIPWRTK